MVVGVVLVAAGAGHDAACAPVRFARGWHGVLAVVAPVPPRQDAFEVAERLVILAVAVRSAGAGGAGATGVPEAAPGAGSAVEAASGVVLSVSWPRNPVPPKANRASTTRPASSKGRMERLRILVVPGVRSIQLGR